MQIERYLDSAREKLGGISDYALAKKLDLTRSHLSSIRLQKRSMPAHAAFKLAITLELDPAEVLADIEAQQEPNAERRKFWEGFLLRARPLAAVLMLAYACTASYASGPGTRGGLDATQVATAVAAAAVLLWALMVRII